MGYYSNVALLLDRETYLDLVNKAKEDTAVMKWLFGESCTPIMDKTDKSVMFHWVEVKWYDDEPGVKFIENYISTLGETHYRYINIGEDSEDITIKGYANLYLNCYIDRTIRFTEYDPEHSDKPIPFKFD